jgi:hypothetical protein
MPDKQINLSLGEWHFLTCLVQGRRNELKTLKHHLRQIGQDLSLCKEDELNKCAKMYKLLNEQVGLKVICQEGIYD